MAKLKGLMDQTPSLYLCDLLIMAIDASFSERLAILNATDVTERFKAGINLLERQLLVLKTASQVGENVNPQKQLAKLQRPRLRGGNSETREDGNEAAEESNFQRLQRMVEGAQMPPDALQKAVRALKKVGDMEKSQQMGPDVMVSLFCPVLLVKPATRMRFAANAAPCCDSLLTTSCVTFQCACLIYSIKKPWPGLSGW